MKGSIFKPELSLYFTIEYIKKNGRKEIFYYTDSQKAQYDYFNIFYKKKDVKLILNMPNNEIFLIFKN